MRNALVEISDEQAQAEIQALIDWLQSVQSQVAKIDLRFTDRDEALTFIRATDLLMMVNSAALGMTAIERSTIDLLANVLSNTTALAVWSKLFFDYPGELSSSATRAAALRMCLIWMYAIGAGAVTLPEPPDVTATLTWLEQARQIRQAQIAQGVEIAPPC